MTKMTEILEISPDLDCNGVDRRSFMKLCSAMATTMGLSGAAAAQMQDALTSPQRPVAIWLGAQECTGCTESLLRATHPTVENLILDVISLEFHEVLSAAAGDQVEEHLHKTLEDYKGKYVLIVDGSIPLKDEGIYCMVAGRPVIASLIEAAEHAAAVIAIGSCSAWGGVAAAHSNPTQAVSLEKVLNDRKLLEEVIPKLQAKGYMHEVNIESVLGKKVVNIPGCPPNPHNLLATIAHFITFGRVPTLDEKGRPLFAYGRLLHEHCERRPHFDAGRFAHQFDDEGHRAGYCLYKLGCKGPMTYGNCSTLEFCDVGGGIWPVGIGHPCCGCNEEGVGFNIPQFSVAKVHDSTPPEHKAAPDQATGVGASAAAVGIIGAIAGLVAGVVVTTVKDLGRQQEQKSDSRRS
ncbi:MAG: hydrogenase small subunit [Saezia sp.]